MIEELEATDPMVYEVNRDLMVQWINRDLLERCGHDVRKSTVLYDKNKMFMHALPACFEFTDIAREAFREAGVRYYSKGIV